MKNLQFFAIGLWKHFFVRKSKLQIKLKSIKKFIRIYFLSFAIGRTSIFIVSAESRSERIFYLPHVWNWFQIIDKHRNQCEEFEDPFSDFLCTQHSLINCTNIFALTIIRYQWQNLFWLISLWRSRKISKINSNVQ